METLTKELETKTETKATEYFTEIPEFIEISKTAIIQVYPHISDDKNRYNINCILINQNKYIATNRKTCIEYIDSFDTRVNILVLFPKESIRAMKQKKVTNVVLNTIKSTVQIFENSQPVPVSEFAVYIYNQNSEKLDNIHKFPDCTRLLTESIEKIKQDPAPAISTIALNPKLLSLFVCASKENLLRLSFTKTVGVTIVRDISKKWTGLIMSGRIS